MVSQSSYGSIRWFLNHHMVKLRRNKNRCWFPDLGFQILVFRAWFPKWFPKIWFLNHRMVPLYGFSIIIWFHYMVSQSSYGIPKYGFSIKNGIPKYGFSIIIWFHYMLSQSSYGSIIWFLNHHMVSQNMVSQSKKWYPKIWFLNHRMVPLYGFSIIIWFHYMVSQSSYGIPKYGFSIKKWYPKIWFLNQNLVNYMFPNQTSAFSRYSATDSSKCISATDSSCFRAQCKGKSRERWYYTKWIP